MEFVLSDKKEDKFDELEICGELSVSFISGLVKVRFLIKKPFRREYGRGDTV